MKGGRSSDDSMQPVLNAIPRLAINGIAGVLVLTIWLVVPRCSASGHKPRLIAHDLHGSTMGTTYHVKLVAPPALTVRDIQIALEAELESINASMSTYRADSELSRINAAASTQWIHVSAPLYAVISAASAVSRATVGAFDVTVGPLVNLWGFGPEIRAARPPSAAAISAARARVGHWKLELQAHPRAIRKTRADVYIDLSAIAKGYAADALAIKLRALGYADFMVEIGGEVAVRGRNAEGRPWQVGLEYPGEGASSLNRVLDLSDLSLATSGDYRNYFEFEGRCYSHEIDPHSGWPVAHALAAVSVVHASAMYADAYATAMMILGPEQGLRYADDLGLAVLFFVRDDARFVEVSSAAFRTRFNSGKSMPLGSPP
ncbi:MAG: FAD:protein FMN transferase [Gammaproteobacteria bacterium]|nr:FAD:protein FMN transferase [Gammaproteobacteria bacterium]